MCCAEPHAERLVLNSYPYDCSFETLSAHRIGAQKGEAQRLCHVFEHGPNENIALLQSPCDAMRVECAAHLKTTAVSDEEPTRECVAMRNNWTGRVDWHVTCGCGK